MPAIEILHVVGQMNRGGVETWLMNVLRRIDRDSFRFTFLVNTKRPGDYDEEIRDLGSRIVCCLGHQHPLPYARSVSSIMAGPHPYHVVHSHVHMYSGLVLSVAASAGVPKRIAHSHSDTRHNRRQAQFWRPAYKHLMRAAIGAFKTRGLAASGSAAEDLFGSSWRNDPSVEIHYCGVDIAAFQQPCDRVALRRTLGLQDDALVVGHVGNFVPAKNHDTLLRIAAVAMKLDARVRLVLVGDGPLRTQIEALARELGIFSKVLFLGKRSDVPRILLGVMDVFLMPSQWEGLPLAAVEAQLAGLPCLLSTRISREVVVNAGQVRWCELSDSHQTWAEAALSCLRMQRDPNSHSAQAIARHFDVEQSMSKLTQIYGSRIGQ